VGTKLIQATLPVLLLVCLLEKAIYSQDTNGETFLPRTLGVFGNFFPLFQANTPVLRPDGSIKRVDPFYQYLELNAASPEHHIFFNTFLRGREVLNGEEESFDVYNAYIQFNNESNAYEIRVGRQIITESTNFYLLDGGLVRVRPVDGIELVAYGGYQDKNIQPEPEQPLNSFGLFGIKLKSDKFLGSLISIGYELLNPDDFSPRHFLNFSFNRVVPFTKSADIYALGEVDVGEGNLALLTTGIGITISKSLHLNFEYDNYKPDEDRDEFLIDPIYDTFSISRLQQARIGLTYIPTSFLEVTSSYSYARYDVFDDESSNGNIARLGFSLDFWRQIGLKAFQGLYFMNGRPDNWALGLNFGVSEEIYRGLDLQFSFAYARFQNISNIEGNAFSYIMGAEYLPIRDLVLKAEVEINTNPILEDDVRVNLGVSYHFSTNL
jgi:hypothetical protein